MISYDNYDTGLSYLSEPTDVPIKTTDLTKGQG
jgi:hypothetical protein